MPKGRPIGLEKSTTPIFDDILDEKSDNKKIKDQKYCVIIGKDKQPLVKLGDKTITIGEREEPIEYFTEAKETATQIIFGKALKQAWQGPNAKCWCDNILETEEDICQKCMQKFNDWELIHHLNEEMDNLLEPQEPISVL